jgi:hypothetical protein
MRSFLSTSLSLSLVLAPAAAVLLTPDDAYAATDGVINGVVTDRNSGDPIEGALVVLQCTCLQGQVERTTNSAGVYSFRDLPAGNYTIQVLYQKANITKVTTLPRGAKFRANFSVDPKNEFRRKIVVKPKAVRSDTSSGVTVDMEQAKNLPVGANTERDFTAVVDLAPTAQRDSAGISLAGTTGAESKYTVEGANVNSPAFGTVGATIIQEFVEQVEVKESGYEAEFGGASGGQITARRVSGTNELRGEAGVRFAPRLAAPRFISSTDEALRVTQVGDYQAQAYAVITGPIKKDKVFFTIGVAPQGTQFSLTQSFHHRVDKDMSGGFEECPYENGDNDCVAGGNYIATEKFAEQKFRTGAISFGYIAGLDYAINPKHRLRLTVQGGPQFTRTTYRLPFSFDPNAFGTNPSSDPLGGSSRIATGVVNNHFGYDLSNQVLVALGYQGRVADDNLEIDIGTSYFQAGGQNAWRIDNPELLDLTATQEQDTQGRNLYEFLDREKATSLVPGVDEACNRADLPGLACPTRVWLSGGVGEYGRDAQRRVEARASLTHFFNAAGAHQVKYGGQFEWLQRHTVSQYSGKNAADFYENCSAGEDGGGEYCYSPQDGYSFFNTLRVNNHRFNVVDTDNPENRFTRGYGTIRAEENDLRALADPLGRGVRVDAYDATVQTFNYGIYLQDKWAILSNLYLSAGVRWEIQDMRDVLGEQSILIWDNVAPRVGLVYDWTDEGKSRLYASYGWFYQPLPLQLSSRIFGGLVQVGRFYRNSDCEGAVTTVGGVAHDRFADGQPTEWCVDTASFTTGLTTGSLVPRLKGQYNEQFQIGYEQEIIEDLVLGFRWLHTDLGRAVEDVSTNGGLNFLVANPGVPVDESDIQAKQNQCDDLQEEFNMLEEMDPDADENNVVARELQQCLFLVDAYDKINTLFDKPVRNYDAWTFSLKKRFAKNWLLLASYTYSRLIGNYDGFVDPITGAINLGASTQYDIPELVRNSFGPLSFNQPHRVKLDGFYSFDLKQAGRLTLGTSFRFASGYPISLRADNNRYAGANLIYVLPRGAGGRVEPNYQWNLSLGYAYPLPKDLEIEFSARVLNVTNAKAVLRVDEVYSFQFTRPIAGGDLGDLKHTKIQSTSNPNEFFSRVILAPQGNFGVETQFQQPLSAQFELKLRF